MEHIQLFVTVFNLTKISNHSFAISFPYSCPFLVAHLTICIPVIVGVLFLFVIITLLRTSFTDPGILPRALPEEAADIERQIGKSDVYED